MAADCKKINSLSYVIQELIFNAIDANSSCIAVRISEDLESFVQVVDNGEGIIENDIQHIGSKVKLEEIKPDQIPAKYGVNGSFLRQLVKHCRLLEIVSRSKTTDCTFKREVSVVKNTFTLQREAKRPSVGTTISVQNVFFQNSEYWNGQCGNKSELEQLQLLMKSYAFLYPHISFSLHSISTGHILSSYRKKKTIKEGFQQITENIGDLLDLNYSSDSFKLRGCVSNKLARTSDSQFVYLNRIFIQRTRIHRFIKDILTKNEIFFIKSTDPQEKEFAFFVEFFCPLSEVFVELRPGKTVIEFREDKLIAKFLLKAFQSFFGKIRNSPIERQKSCGIPLFEQREAEEKLILKQPTKSRKIPTLDKIISDWLSPRFGYLNPPMEDQDSGITLPIGNESPKLTSINFESLSGSIRFIPEEKDRPGCSENSSLKRISESKFAPKKKLKLLPNSSIVTVDVNIDGTQDSSFQEKEEYNQQLWVPGAIEESEYFARLITKMPTSFKPPTGTAEVMELINSWENPMFQHSAPLVITRVQPPKSCTFSQQSLSACTVLSQVDNKFIACLISDVSNRQCLVLVDQHAAHERVRLELLTKHYSTQDHAGSITSMKFSGVDPVFAIKTPLIDLDQKENVTNYLKRCGILVKFTGSSSAQVLAVPSCFLARGASEVKHGRSFVHSQLAEKLISEKYEEFIASKGGSAHPMSAVVRNILNSLACHGAIKFGDKLTDDECRQLMEALSRCENPFQCAHGRPVLSVLLDMKQLTQFESFSSLFISKPKLNNLVRRFQL